VARCEVRSRTLAYQRNVGIRDARQNGLVIGPLFEATIWDFVNINILAFRQSEREVRFRTLRLRRKTFNRELSSGIREYVVRPVHTK
jgi:hypothetical protein